MKKTTLPLVIALLFTAGCSTAWLTTVEDWAKVIGPILISILDIVAEQKGDPPDPALVAKINADQAAVISLANSIQVAQNTNPASACAAFNTAVATFASDLAQIETLANIGPGTSTTILSSVGIAQGALSGLEAPLAACANAPSPAAAKLALVRGALTVKSPSDVVSKFNAVVDRKHRVHLHSGFVRAITFGVAK